MGILKNLIEKSVKENKEKTFIIDCGKYFIKKYSYEEIHNNSLKIVSFFERQGIKKGDRIIVYLPNSSHYVSIIFACAISGVIFVPADFNSNLEFLKKIDKEVEAKLIFCTLFKHYKTKKNFFIEEIEKIYSNFSQTKKEYKINPEDVFEIVYTSGTTSNPKGVVLTNENLYSNVTSMVKSITFNTKNLSMLSILPLSHLFEQNLGLFSPIVLGAKISYLESKKNSEILEKIKKNKINAIVCVPFFLETIKEKVVKETKGKLNLFTKLLIKKKFYPLKYFIVGGSHLSLEVEKFWKNLGFWVLQGYGLTETSPVLTCNSTKFYKEGTVGKPLEGIEIKLENKEIVVRGKNVFKEYYKNKSETKKVKKNDWFYTGDLGEFDEEGFLKIIGRKKNVIISPSGLNIYPEDIEKVIKEFNEVKDAVVLGLNNGKDLVAVLLIKEKINEKELLKKINSKLNPSQRLNKIFIWSEKDFPRTTTLKIIKKSIEERILNKIPIKKEESEDPLLKIISDICNCNLKNIDKNKKLVELGMDSIKRIELINKIEDFFNIEIEESKINEKTTIKDLRKEIKNPSIKEKSKTGINFLNSKIFNPIRFILQEIAFLGIIPFCDIKVIGEENFPKKNCIIIANHVSMFDSFVLYKIFPWRIRLNCCAAAAKDFFFKNKITGFLGRLTFNAFGFSRKENTKQSLKDFGELLNRGFNILVYPEGTRSRDGKLLEFKEGIGILARESGIDVLPIKIEGLYDILPVGSLFPKKRGKVFVKIGKPIKFSLIQSSEEITKILYNTIKNM